MEADGGAGGLEALQAKPHPGQSPQLTSEQKEELAAVLLMGARATGFPTELWALSQVAKGMAREFGVRYLAGHVWRILRGMGWGCRKPEHRARERDEAAVREWREKGWEQVKKSLRERMVYRLHRQSGFMLPSVVRRAWASIGKTLIQLGSARPAADDRRDDGFSFAPSLGPLF